MVKRTEYDFLKPYAPIIGRKLKSYKDTNERGCLGRLAKSLRLDQSRISNFIQYVQDGQGKIELTPTYIYAFIRGGFITVEELLRGKNLAEMSETEREFWADAKCLEDKELRSICKTDPALIDLIKRIKRKGRDPKPILLAAFPSDEL